MNSSCGLHTAHCCALQLACTILVLAWQVQGHRLRSLTQTLAVGNWVRVGALVGGRVSGWVSELEGE